MSKAKCSRRDGPRPAGSTRPERRRWAALQVNSNFSGRTVLPAAVACIVLAFTIASLAPHPPWSWAAAPFALIGLTLFFRSQPSERTPRKQFWLVLAASLIMVAALLFIVGGWFSMFRLLG